MIWGENPPFKETKHPYRSRAILHFHQQYRITRGVQHRCSPSNLESSGWGDPVLLDLPGGSSQDGDGRTCGEGSLPFFQPWSERVKGHLEGVPTTPGIGDLLEGLYTKPRDGGFFERTIPSKCSFGQIVINS